jgi:hypothetical protein
MCYNIVTMLLDIFAVEIIALLVLLTVAALAWLKIRRLEARITDYWLGLNAKGSEPNSNSRLEIIIGSVVQSVGVSVAQSLKAMLMNEASVTSRQAKALEGDLAEAQLGGGPLGLLVASNPGLRKLARKFGPLISAATGALAPKRIEHSANSNGGVPPKFNL